MNECLNCLQSTSGFCGLHKQKTYNVIYTTSTSTGGRKYSRREVELEVLYHSGVLCKMKWYQSKRWIIKRLKYWVDFLKLFDKN